MKKYNKKQKKLLKNLIDIRCDCKQHISREKYRSRFGVCRCDTYANRLPDIMANFLFQYVADAKGTIVSENWDIIEKHARAIKDYAEADDWDRGSDKSDTRWIYLEKERKFREAMYWLTENIKSLWW